MTSDGQTTIMAALESDHRSVLAQLDQPGLGDETGDALAAREELVMTLVRHFVAEEQYFYPLVRDHFEDGAQAADEGLSADRAVEQLLRRFEDRTLDPEALRRSVGEVAEAFRAHVARQQPQLARFPEIRPAQELLELGDDVLGAEQVGPTRPRRVVSDSPEANKVISFVEGFLDQVRDYYGHRRGEQPPAPE